MTSIFITHDTKMTRISLNLEIAMQYVNRVTYLFDIPWKIIHYPFDVCEDLR